MLLPPCHDSLILCHGSTDFNLFCLVLKTSVTYNSGFMSRRFIRITCYNGTSAAWLCRESLHSVKSHCRKSEDSPHRVYNSMSFFVLVYDRFPQFFTSIIKQSQSAMLITLCLIILGYMIVGKDVKPWVEKLKSVDWKSKAL